MCVVFLKAKKEEGFIFPVIINITEKQRQGSGNIYAFSLILVWIPK